MAEHAKLSPSSVDRWAVCTKAPEMEFGLPEQESIYADEGTAAHATLEECLKTGKMPEDPELKVAYDALVPYLSTPGVMLFSETQVHLSPEVWGTADVTIVDNANRTLIVGDLKWGRGVLVEADCGQLKVYLCAARKTFAPFFDHPPEKFVAMIMQPRAAHPEGPVRIKTYTVDELDSFEGFIADVVKRIEAGKTEFNPGDKACRWCRAKIGDPASGRGPCPAIAEAALTAVQAQFQPITPAGVQPLAVPPKSDAVTLSHAQIAGILAARGLIQDFISAVEAAAFAVINSGGSIPGFKIVEGRSNRKFLEENEEELVKRLTEELKLKKSEIYEPKLMGPAKIEKLIDPKARNGKKKWEALQAMITKPEGKPTLVSESDKREPIKRLEPVSNPLG